MARTPRKNKGGRLNLDLGIKAKKQIKKIRDQTNAESLTEVVRKSLSVYNYLVTAEKEGYEVILTKGGEKTRLILLWKN